MKFLESIKEILKQEFGNRPALQPGDQIEWKSEALPVQTGEVLAISGDYFDAYHPLSECVCRMPVAWITRNITTTPTQEGPTP